MDNEVACTIMDMVNYIAMYIYIVSFTVKQLASQLHHTQNAWMYKMQVDLCMYN